MSQDIYVARSSAVAARKLGREMMMSGQDSTLFTLDEVATIICESVDGLVTLDETVELRICAEFDVETAAALLDVEMVAEALAQDRILDISRQPILDSNAPLGSAE
jgi:Coenzyme PQQ synthesis protein D (PqqD)